MYKPADAFQFAGDAACGTGSQSHHKSSTNKWLCFRMNFSNILTHISEDAAFSEIAEKGSTHNTLKHTHWCPVT